MAIVEQLVGDETEASPPGVYGISGYVLQHIGMDGRERLAFVVGALAAVPYPGGWEGIAPEGTLITLDYPNPIEIETLLAAAEPWSPPDQ